MTLFGDLECIGGAFHVGLDAVESEQTLHRLCCVVLHLNDAWVMHG